MLFFDTSALVKWYADEQGTQTVDQLIETPENTIVITSLSVIEIASAFRRKYNRGDITKEKRDNLLVSFFEEATERFTVIPVDERIVETAFALVLDDDLRTLDSLQLAAAVSLPTPNPDITFVCADKELVDVAAQHGLATNNPRDWKSGPSDYSLGNTSIRRTLDTVGCVPRKDEGIVKNDGLSPTKFTRSPD